MANRLKFDWNDVSQLYVDKHLSLSQIANLKGCSTGSVCYVLEKAGIPRRQGSVATLGHGHNTKRWEDLEYLYITKQLPIYQIARIKHAIPRTVRKYLKAADIPIRTYTEAQQLRAELAGKTRYKHSSLGYIFVWNPTHPRAINGYVREHILIWEEVHAKPLPKGWVIHHLNGVRSDNRPENLIALPLRSHNTLAASFQKRIRELEAKVKLLERALENGQLIWWSEN